MARPISTLQPLWYTPPSTLREWRHVPVAIEAMKMIALDFLGEIQGLRAEVEQLNGALLLHMTSNPNSTDPREQLEKAHERILARLRRLRTLINEFEDAYASLNVLLRRLGTASLTIEDRRSLEAKRDELRELRLRSQLKMIPGAVDALKAEVSTLHRMEGELETILSQVVELTLTDLDELEPDRSLLVHAHELFARVTTRIDELLG